MLETGFPWCRETSIRVGNEARHAAYLRLALQLGVKSVPDVVQWADSRIKSAEQPDEPLLDLSLMSDSHPLDVIGEPGKVSGPVTPLDVFGAVLADAHAALLDDPSFGRPLAKNLYHFYVEKDYPGGFDECCALDDDYALSDQGIGTEEDAYRRVLEYTRRYVDRAS